MTLLFVIGVMLFAIGAFVIRSGYISIGLWLNTLGVSCMIAAIWQALG